MTSQIELVATGWTHFISINSQLTFVEILQHVILPFAPDQLSDVVRGIPLRSQFFIMNALYCQGVPAEQSSAFVFLISPYQSQR